VSRAALVERGPVGDGVRVSSVLHVLFLAGALLPLVAMLSALFAAVWIREGEREREALAPRSQQR
jgi:hypothetical protein